MEKPIFGPSGNSHNFYDDGNKVSEQAPKWLNGLGLDAFEYSFGRGYTMSYAKAELIGNKCLEHGVLASVHAPYYINLANESDEMAEKSINYIIEGLKYLQCFNGKHLVIHAGSQCKLTRDKALGLIKERLQRIARIVKENGFSNFKICLETMGKPAQIGDYKEIVDLCKIDNMFVPCFDFGHINALSGGKLTEQKDYDEIFGYAIRELGFERVKECHIHFSKIQFGAKGEIRHLNFDDETYGPKFEPLAKSLVSLGLTPHIICESMSEMSEDAIVMKKTYENLLKTQQIG